MPLLRAAATPNVLVHGIQAEARNICQQLSWIPYHPYIVPRWTLLDRRYRTWIRPVLPTSEMHRALARAVELDEHDALPGAEQ